MPGPVPVPIALDEAERVGVTRFGRPVARVVLVYADGARASSAPPAHPMQSSSRRGASMTPMIGRPSSSKAINVVQLGRPQTKARVPSTGSRLQLYRPCAGRSGNSSPAMPWSG